MSVEERATAVRMQRLSGTAKVLILLAFLATTATVYLVLGGQSDEAPVYSARATVGHPALTPAEDDGTQAANSALSGVDEIKRAIADEANLRPLLAELAGIEPESVSDAEIEGLRRRLRIDVDMPGEGQAVEATLCFRDPDPDRAAAVVDRLAEAYASLCRRTLQAPARHQHEVAVRNAAEASQRRQQAQQQLVQFLQEHFDRHAAHAEGRESAAGLSPGWSSVPIVLPARFASHASQVRPVSDEVSLVDNPEWLDLNDRLEKLAERRRQLLVNLMPAHPRIHQIDQEIDRLETLLRDVPERVPDRHAPAVGAPPPEAPEIKPPVIQPSLGPPDVVPEQGPDLPLPPAPPGFSPEEHAQAARDYQRLAAAADRAEHEFLKSIEQERTALAVMVVPAPVTCRFSAGMAAPTGGMGTTDVLAAALLAGLAAAIGLAMVLLAQSHRETFASVEEAAAVLPVPVVGTVPASEASRRLDATTRSPLAGALTAGGVTLVLICAGIIAVALNR